MQLWDKKMGEGIKLRRKEMNIRQVDLAKRLHVESSTISRWETGSGSPDISILPDLAYELGTTVDDLMRIKPKNKEDEIKKEKISIVKILSNACKVCVVLIIMLIIVMEVFYKTSLYITSYIHIDVILKYVAFSIVNIISVILIFFNSVKKVLIYKFYKYKYIHKYPIGYKFEIKETYLYFLNIVIFIAAILFDVLLILG